MSYHEKVHRRIQEQVKVLGSKWGDLKAFQDFPSETEIKNRRCNKCVDKFIDGTGKEEICCKCITCEEVLPIRWAFVSGTKGHRGDCRLCNRDYQKNRSRNAKRRAQRAQRKRSEISQGPPPQTFKERILRLLEKRQDIDNEILDILTEEEVRMNRFMKDLTESI